MTTEAPKSLGKDVPELALLLAFYKAVECVAVEVDALLRMAPDEPLESMRAVSVRLCSAHQKLQNAKEAALVSCPGLFTGTQALAQALDTFVDSQSARVWRLALATPLAALSLVIAGLVEKDQEKDHLEKVNASLGTMADAHLLVTGFLDKESKENAELSSAFVEHALTCVQKSLASDARQGQLAHASFQLLKVLGLRKNSDKLESKITIDPDAVRFLIWTVWTYPQFAYCLALSYLF